MSGDKIYERLFPSTNMDQQCMCRYPPRACGMEFKFQVISSIVLLPSRVISQCKLLSRITSHLTDP